MKKLFQLLGHKEPTQGTFGIEIEAEGDGMSVVKNKYWRTEDDGSLRGEYPEGRAEFVLAKPITEEHVKPALESLVKALDGAKFDFSYRTSVHVHINVQELTMPQILNFIYTYLLLEEPLMTYCGKSRKNNRFCLRLRDAEGMLDVMARMFRGGEGTHILANDNVRYSAINLAALNKYGSIEFRGMRGNMDVEVIHTWTKALNKLREFALGHKDPKAILAIIEKQGSVGFMQLVLGELFENFFYPRAPKDIASSFSLSLDLPYAYVDKESVKEVKAAPKFDLEANPAGLVALQAAAARMRANNPQMVDVVLPPHPVRPVRVQERHPDEPIPQNPVPGERVWHGNRCFEFIDDVVRWKALPEAEW